MARMEDDVSKDLELVDHLDNLAREHPDFEVHHESTFNNYSFRYVPNVLAERQDEREVQQMLDLLNEMIVESVQRDDHGLLTMTYVGRRVAIRMSLRSQTTSKVDIDRTFEAIALMGRLLAKQLFPRFGITPDMETQPCLSESDSSSSEASVT